MTVLIDRAPEIMQLAADPDENLVPEPLVAWPRPRRLSELANNRPKRRPQSRMLS